MNKKYAMNVTTTMLLLLFMCFSITGCNDDDKDVTVPDNWVTVPSDPLTIDYKGGDLSCDYTLAPGLDASVVYVISHELWASGYIDYDQEKNLNVLKIEVEESELIEEREAKFTLCYDDKHQTEISVIQAPAPPTMVTEIITDNIPVSIRMNETLNLNDYTSVLPSNASYKTLRFTVAEGSEKIISISADGILSCKTGGNATINITTTDGSNITTTATITIENNILFDRKNWTVSTSANYTLSTGGTLNYIGDYNNNLPGQTGEPEAMFDGSSKTYFAILKAEKSSFAPNAGKYKGVTFSQTPGGSLYFIVDMKEQQKFNYFYIGHRSDNTTSGLRVSKVKIHGSNDGSTFTQIDNEITLNKTQNINYPVTTSTYRYVKIEYSAWESASSTLQIAEFNLGMNYALE